MTNEQKIAELERVLAESPGLRTTTDAVRLIAKLERQLEADDEPEPVELDPFADLDEPVTG